MNENEKIQEAYEKSIITPELNEINKAKFSKEIDRAKGNKNRLSNLKKTIAAMGTMLPKDDIKYLLSKIETYM